MTERALEQERQRRARLANMRHELLAPVTALVGYSELLIEKARGLELEDIGPDLQRILISAQELLELIDRLLGVDGAAGHHQASISASFRPSSGTICVTPECDQGLCRATLEELDEVGAAATRLDLEALLSEADSLLSRVDVIIDSRAAETPRWGRTGRSDQHDRQSGPDRKTDRRGLHGTERDRADSRGRRQCQQSRPSIPPPEPRRSPCCPSGSGRRRRWRFSRSRNSI